MDLIGSLTDILKSVAQIDEGRKGLSTDGEEHEGRLSYEKGIANASTAFSYAVSTAEPKIIMLVEEAFVEQELRFCSTEDSYTRNSLTQALQSFEDAFRCIETVEDSAGYTAADTTWPHSPRYRVRNFPKDAFHLACIAHRTRLHNTLRSPGINMIEKEVLEQRASNMTAAQAAYIEKQKRALGAENS